MDKSSSSRPWAHGRRSLEPPHFTAQLGMALAVQDRCIYLRCASPSALQALARGVASFLPRPVSVFVLRSDQVLAEDAARVTQALHRGASVVLAGRGPSELMVELANQWAECTSCLDGSSFVYAGFVLQAVEGAGLLALVHVDTAQAPLPPKATICRVPADEVATLEVLGQDSLIAAVHELG